MAQRIESVTASSRTARDVTPSGGRRPTHGAPAMRPSADVDNLEQSSPLLLTYPLWRQRQRVQLAAKLVT